MTKEKKYSRRKQQVKRQILLIVVVAVLAVGSLGTYIVRSSAGKQETTEAAGSPGAKTDTGAPEDPSGGETQEERLARVKRTAVEENYPEEVVELLDKNEETVEFVEAYPNKKDCAPARTIGTDLTKGEIPELIQWDGRWGYTSYGTSVVAASGCGPTCLAMVAAGLTGDPSVTPARVAAYSDKHGYVDENNNTYWRLMSEGCRDFGLSCYEGEIRESAVVSELKAGHPVICSVGPGDFTDKGHFIVLAGYEDGKIKVNDPFSLANTQKLWDFKRLKGQIKALWVFSLKK